MEGSIKFISYNLEWNTFDKSYEINIKKILNIVKKENPDVIVLQNISTLYYEKLGREMGYIHYKRYIPESFQQKNIGDIIFSKYSFENVVYLEFQKNTEKKGIFLLGMNLTENSKLWICSAQLDKLFYLQTYQLSNINKMIEKYVLPADSVIMGIDTKSFEYNDTSTLEGWYDAWYECGTSCTKYTLDSLSNHLATPPFLDRPDRVWYKSTLVECNSFRLLGENEDISSHYGIACNFTY